MSSDELIFDEKGKGIRELLAEVSQKIQAELQPEEEFHLEVTKKTVRYAVDWKQGFR